MKNERLTAREAAEIIGVEYQTLLNWHSKKTHVDALPIHSKPNGRLYLMSKDVARFAKAYAI